MKLQLLLLLVATITAMPLESRNEAIADADEAVNYPASVDVSWVNAKARSVEEADADEAVNYPAKVDVSWVNAA